MTTDSELPQKSSKALVITMLLVMAGVALSILIVSSPSEKILGESAYRMHSAFHGLFAGIFMITSTIGLFQAFRLWGGEPIRVRELEVGSLLNAFACFLTIVFGNWIYIPYRGLGGPRAHFLEKSPEIHKIFFEFKEFTALFTLPLTVIAAYLICTYAKSLNSNKAIRETVALLLLLVFFYFLMAFGLGAAITKLKSV